MAASPASFLSLPYSIRREIYILAGLSRLCPIPINPEQRVRTQYPPIPPIIGRDGRECRYKNLLLGYWGANFKSEPDCFCPKIPNQLLLVSKTIYHEAHRILYRENSFIIRAHKAKDLAVLKALSSDSIHEMIYLMVRLNCWPCRYGHERINRHGECIGCSTLNCMRDPVLRSGNSESEEMVQSWLEVCRILGSSVTDGRLSLAFICDVADIEIAARILRPLEELPSLKSCTIRLGRTRDDELRSLARTTACKLTAAIEVAEQGSSPNPFENLPREIRLRILELTHLGKYGTFSKKQYPRARDYTNLLLGQGRLVQQVEPRLGVKQTCCNDCNFTKKDCCCPSRYAAFSPSCECRVLPLELMLVSRQMDADASEILYTTNAFILRDSFGGILHFFKSLRPSTLKLFRRITFILDSDETSSWSDYEEDWTELISFIRDNLSVSKLIITIDPIQEAEIAMWKEMMNPMREAYIGLTKVVKNLLSGLRGYHLKLSVHEELAMRLEEEVMGPGWSAIKWQHT